MPSRRLQTGVIADDPYLANSLPVRIGHAARCADSQLCRFVYAEGPKDNRDGCVSGRQ